MKMIIEKPKASLALLAGVILPIVALLCSIAIFSEDAQ